MIVQLDVNATSGPPTKVVSSSTCRATLRTPTFAKLIAAAGFTHLYEASEMYPKWRKAVIISQCGPGLCASRLTDQELRYIEAGTGWRMRFDSIAKSK